MNPQCTCRWFRKDFNGGYVSVFYPYDKKTGKYRESHTERTPTSDGCLRLLAKKRLVMRCPHAGDPAACPKARTGPPCRVKAGDCLGTNAAGTVTAPGRGATGAEVTTQLKGKS